MSTFTSSIAERIQPWLTEPPYPDRRHLFCFPYAGGGAAVYRDWAAHLPPDIQLCPIELPGRGRRFGTSPFRSLSTLVANLGLVLHPYLNQPFAIFGHSMGALIGFELTRWLRRHQAPLPKYLFVSGRSAPQVPNPIPAIHRRSDQDFIAGLRAYNGTPESILNYPELMEILLPTLRADFELFETYQYHHETPLVCPIYSFAGQADPLTPPPTVQAWQTQTTAYFKEFWFPGAHFFLQDSKQQVINYCAQALCEDRMQ